MSDKYVRLKDVINLLATEYYTNAIAEGYEVESEKDFIAEAVHNTKHLPSIDIVKCEECMWHNDCLQFVASIDRTATALRWCSDGERREE